MSWTKNISKTIVAVAAVACLFAVGSVAQADLVGYWDFNDNVVDQSPNFAQDGTLQGGTAFDGADVPYGAGTNKSIDFTNTSPNAGTGVQLAVTANNGVHALGTGDYTIAFWIKREDTNASPIFGNSNTNTSGGQTENQGWGWTIGAAGQGGGAIVMSGQQDSVGGFGASAMASAGDSSTVANNTWTHVAAVRTAGSLNFFVDGVSLAPSSTGSPSRDLSVNTTTGMWLGGQLGAADSFNGRLDDLAWFNEALSQTQVQTILTGDFSAFGVGGGGGAIPEPSTAVLGLMGLVAVVLVHHRRRRK